MPVKRSLKLDDQFEESSFDPSRITSKRSMTEYSPTTGTCRISPFSSPTTSEKQEYRASLSCGKRSKPNHPILIRRMDSTTKENDELMMLLSKVEQSSEEIMKIMQNLRSTQALEGNRELENLIGISHAPCFLKGEVEKTKELLIKVTKQKLFVKKSSELPQKEHHLDSYEFLKAILN
uniref:centromere protein R isoform X2 n=1 Tax=Jaculus jaculus TaxID=51337 RepID=UPI001E1B09C9|nr:centromere protein R isoform X2 [Jaculus jaculus]XP_045007093.1 centromere protein R isoform X2 [Jaculus jaculus]XP_045007094.1 centromere protein R isoform X2 [Jaculus jaculus]